MDTWDLSFADSCHTAIMLSNRQTTSACAVADPGTEAGATDRGVPAGPHLPLPDRPSARAEVRQQRQHTCTPQLLNKGKAMADTLHHPTVLSTRYWSFPVAAAKWLQGRAAPSRLPCILHSRSNRCYPCPTHSGRVFYTRPLSAVPSLSPQAGD